MVFFLRDGIGVNALDPSGLPGAYRLDTLYSRDSSADRMSHSALDSFFASVERDAYRLALAAVRDEDEAIDLVQDAMLTLLKRYRDKAEDEWAPLFFRILQNQIRDWYRRHAVKHALLRWTGLGDTTEQIANIHAPTSDNPEQANVVAESLSIIEEAIQKLPYRQQQVFLLRSWKEWSVADTARIMSISESSVKTHHGRALTALRKSLSEDMLQGVDVMNSDNSSAVPGD